MKNKFANQKQLVKETKTDLTRKADALPFGDSNPQWNKTPSRREQPKVMDTPYAGEEYIKPTDLAIDKRLKKNSHLWESDTTKYYH